ncbi:MAG: bifunctional DNA primase/polymerase [Chloroflexi bacterium]|nr:bifunctional DNA primase/polymerase [Chloroflexota bacterium]MCI0644950.1 bifunctional DNA primase/polymerase [Chloroflexota bacterium]
MKDLYPFGQKLHQWGAAVTAIQPKRKSPLHEWAHWQSRPQTAEELASLPWEQAAAVGIVNGSGGFRVFDVDPQKDAQGRPLYKVPEQVLIAALRAVGLPDDYQWSYASGSGAGWGFIVRCTDNLPAGWPADKGIFKGTSANGYQYDHLELRWSSGQTVIMGSHPDGPGYCWRRGEPPFVPPAEVTAGQVERGFLAIAVPKHEQPAGSEHITRPETTRPARKVSGGPDTTVEEIRGRFDLLAYARRHFPGEVREEKGEYRILGNGGLLIKPDTGKWFCFAEDLGGDCFDLVGYCFYGATWFGSKKDGEKWGQVLQDAAAFTGVALPDNSPAFHVGDVVTAVINGVPKAVGRVMAVKWLPPEGGQWRPYYELERLP